MRKRVVIILSLLTVIAFGFNSYIMADDIQNEESNVEEKNTDVLDKENILKNIKDCKEELKQELIKIDNKIETIKKKQEYITYPAIRLNVDTPIFGLSSVCNYKLKITSEVSTADVASGYSIKDIIRNNSLKVPSFSVGSIVVITRDIEFNEDITLIDANTAVLKLMQYIEQVESVNEFLDKQISKIYSEYIPKEKSEKIQSLKSRINNLKSGLDEIDPKIAKIYISCIDSEKYLEYYNQYLKINSLVYDYDDALKNILIEDNMLLEYEKKIVELESQYLNLKQNVLDSESVINEKLDLENMLINIRETLINKKNIIEKYINESAIKKEVVNQDSVVENTNEENEIEAQSEIKSDEGNVTETATEEIKVYDVTSTKNFDNLGKDIESIDKKIIELLGQDILDKINNVDKKEINEEIANKEEVNNVLTNEITSQKKDETLSEMLKIYNDFLINENKFYSDNINLILKDTTTKISSLSKYTDYSTISDIRYIYMELPRALKKDLDLYSMKKNIDLECLEKNLYEKLQKLISVNVNITKVYNEKISQGIDM